MLCTGELQTHAIKYNQMHLIIMNYSGLMNFSLSLELIPYFRITFVQ